MNLILGLVWKFGGEKRRVMGREIWKKMEKYLTLVPQIQFFSSPSEKSFVLWRKINPPKPFHLNVLYFFHLFLCFFFQNPLFPSPLLQTRKQSLGVILLRAELIFLFWRSQTNPSKLRSRRFKPKTLRETQFKNLKRSIV